MFVLEQIHESAATSPRKLALVFNGAPLSYGTFWRFIEGCRRSLQPHLSAQGIAVVWVDSLLECWILDLALRSLGLDVACIKSRDQIDLFDGLDVACLITLESETGKDVGTAYNRRHLVLSAPSKQSVPVDAPLPPLSEDLGTGGHIKLTSGTTGRNKMVMTTWGATREPIEQRRVRYAQLGDRIVQPSDQSVVNVFNMGLWTGGGYNWPIFIWSLGGAVVIEQTDDLHRSFDWPGITHTLITPRYLSGLISLPDDAFPFRPEMQLIVVSGAVSPTLWREAKKRLSAKILIKLSSTEIGAWARSLVETETDLRWYQVYATRRVEVVNETDVALGAGQLGRVRVALQENDANGYLGDPESTADVFAGGWFYPGDLGVLDGEGRLALYGRGSDIVSLNGEKYPAEPWERAIQEKLGCEAVCVLSGNWRTDADRLHVFIETHRLIAVPNLADALRASLPGIGRIQAHIVDALPRTDTGKVKRMILAQQLHEGSFQPDPAQVY